MKPLAIASCAMMLALAVPAAAQAAQQALDQQADRSRAQTDQGGKQQPGGGGLSEKLNDCGGV